MILVLQSKMQVAHMTECFNQSPELVAGYGLDHDIQLKTAHGLLLPTGHRHLHAFCKVHVHFACKVCAKGIAEQSSCIGRSSLKRSA